MKLFVLLFSFLLLTATLQSKTITIDLSQTYQTIDHFGASDCWSMQKIGEWDEVSKNRVADLLFSPTEGIGLTSWRFNIGGGINKTTIHHPWRTVETFEISQGEYDWNRQKEERWFLHAAKERGVETFIAFVNSPPARMTRNGYTNCTENLGSTNLKPGYESQFAVYLVDILKHFRDEWNIDFDYISPVNEPQWEWNNGCNQEGNRAANQDIIAIVEALYDELQTQGVETEISLVESGDLKSWYQSNASMYSKYGQKYGRYLRELFSNPRISDKIANHFCGHSYWSDRLNGQLVEHRQRVKPFFAPYLNEGWTYWASEYCILDGPQGAGGHGRDLTIKTALDVARVIHYDLTILDASSWSWWTAVSPENYKDGLLYTNYKSTPGKPSIIESKTLWAFGHFSRFIRPGSIRIQLAGADDVTGLMASAYLNSKGNQLIIVFINVSNSPQKVTFSLSGIGPHQKIESLTPFVTTHSSGIDLQAYPEISLADLYTVPGRSLVTMLGDIIPSSDVKTGSNTPPADFDLSSFPNPFNDSTRIHFSIDRDSNIECQIFNNRGQNIKTILQGFRPSGSYLANWDGTDQAGKSVSSGVYFCSLESESCRQMIKLVLVH